MARPRPLGARLLGLTLAMVVTTGVLAAVAVGLAFRGRIGDSIEQLLTSQLTSAVETAAARLSGDAVRDVYRSHSYDDAGYRSQQTILRSVQKSYRLSTDLYTLHREGERTRFGITCKDEPLLGEAYALNPAMRRAFDQGEVTTSGVYRDKSGWWISAYAPIHGTDGTVVALVEADHSLDPYVTQTRNRVFAAGAIALLAALLLTAAIGSGMIGRILRPLDTLARSAQRLAAGELEESEPPSLGTSDAAGRLGEALAQIRAQLLRSRRPDGNS